MTPLNDFRNNQKSVITKNRKGFCVLVLNMQQNFVLCIDVNV